MHVITVSLKRGPESKGEQGGAYGRVWKEEREQRNIVIKLQAQKGKKFKNKNKKKNDTSSPVFILKDCLDYGGCFVLPCEF